MSPNNALKLTGPAQATEPRSLAPCWTDIEDEVLRRKSVGRGASRDEGAGAEPFRSIEAWIGCDEGAPPSLVKAPSSRVRSRPGRCVSERSCDHDVRGGPTKGWSGRATPGPYGGAARRSSPCWANT